MDLRFFLFTCEELSSLLQRELPRTALGQSKKLRVFTKFISQFIIDGVFLEGKLDQIRNVKCSRHNTV